MLIDNYGYYEDDSMVARGDKWQELGCHVRPDCHFHRVSSMRYRRIGADANAADVLCQGQVDAGARRDIETDRMVEIWRTLQEPE
jgi:hypothetical protein